MSSTPPLTPETAPDTGDAPVRTAEIASLALRYNRLLEPFLLVLMVTAMMMGPLVLIRLVTPNYPWSHLPALIFFVALEGVFTTTWLMHPDRLILNKPRYRLAEFLLLLLIVRLITWAIYVPLTWQSIRLYLLDPLSFLDGAFLIVAVVVLFTWAQASTFAARLNELALNPAEREYLTRSAADTREQRFAGAALTTMSDRSGIVARFFSQWLNGGLLLMLSGALSTVNLEALGNSEFTLRSLRGLGLQPEVLGALLLYFVAGLYVLSSGRLQMMRVRWLLDRADTAPNLERTWRRSSIALLLAIGFAAAFLPIGSTVPIAVIINVALDALVVLASFVVGVVTLVFVLLATLFGRGTAAGADEPNVPGEIFPDPTPAPLESSSGLSESARLAVGGGFWLIVIVLVTVAVLFYLRERGFRFNSTLLRLLWADLRRGWRALWGGLSTRAQSVSGAVRNRLRVRGAADAPDAPPFRFIRVNGLPPRERIRYFYLSTVRRAADRGAPRRNDETPLEYLDALKSRWPQAEEDLDALTDAFLEARYSKQPFSEADVNPIKRTWQRVKSGLRRKPPPPADTPPQEPLA